jgi:hypothetical protein
MKKLDRGFEKEFNPNLFYRDQTGKRITDSDVMKKIK